MPELASVSRASGPIRAVAINLDGTLLDTVGEIAAAANGMLRILGHDGETTLPPGRVAATLRVRALPDNAVRDMVGQGIANLVHRALAAATGGEPDATLVEQAVAIYQDCYLSLLGTTTVPYPGVLEGLDRMRGMNLPLACVTNKATRFTLPLLERLGLRDRFAHLVCGDTYERRKPDALPLLRTAERFGCLPRELLMIGDSVNDVAAARAAGCPILCVPYGYNEGHPVDNLDFDGMIPTLLEACDWIEERSARAAVHANRP